MEQFIQLSAERHFEVVDVPADGNCALHAVVHQLSTQGIAVDSRSLRQQAVSYLRRHPMLLDENFLQRREYATTELYLTRQSRDGQWVDEMMMRAISACVWRDINILHDNGNETILELDLGESSDIVNEPGIQNQPLYVGLISELHYVSLLKMRHEDLEGKPSHALGKPGPILDADEQQCWPSVWTEKVWQEKLNKYPFLVVNNGKLGCSSCRAVSSLQAFSGQGSHLSAEWTNCQIVANGKGRREQLTSLRKKIFEHSNSTAHISAETIGREKEKQKMNKLAEKMVDDDENLNSKAFRTAYYLAKKHRPFSDYQSLLELQEANGSTFGVGLRSRYSATQIVSHIAHIETGSSFAVLIDESTTVSNKSALVIYLKCVAKPDGEPSFMFLHLIELADQKAATITQALLKCLHQYGFTDDYMHSHFIAFASDGASVMTGKKSGVAAQLMQKFPNLIAWHCLNHRLELAVGDAVDETQGTSHFQSFMDCL